MIFLRNGTALSSRGGTVIDPVVETPLPDLLLVTHGDSITRDVGADNYTFVLAGLIRSGQSLEPRVLQRGINGISWAYRWGGEPYTATLIEDAPGQIDAIQVPGIPNWLIAFAGTNGVNLAHNGISTELGHCETYAEARIPAGWDADRIILPTMFPRGGGGINEAGWNSYNSGLVTLAAGLGCRVARFDLMPGYGWGAQNDIDKFYDGTHPTAATHALMAQVIYETMYP